MEKTLLFAGHVTTGELLDVYPESQDSVQCSTVFATDVASHLVVTYPVVGAVQVLASNAHLRSAREQPVIELLDLR